MPMKIFTLLVVFVALPSLCYAQLPTLSGSLPARNSSAGSRTGPVKLTFTKPVANPAAIRLSTNLFAGQRAGTFNGGGTSQLSFQPTQPFAPGEHVSISVPATVSSPPQVIEFLAAAGRGTAVFSAPVTINTPPSVLPKIVTAGDLDQDGDIDLVVGEFATTHICLNDGAGNFTTQPTAVSAATQPVDLRLADFNGDGFLDLLSIGTNANGIWLSLGTGRGTFLGRTQLLDTSFTAQVITGDFNADGFPDALVGEPAGTGTTLSFLAGSGNGLTTPAYTTQLLAQARDLGVADMDEDGDLDMLLLTDANVGVYLNDGNGRLTIGPTRTVNPIAFELTVGDFTSDGHADVVCSSYQGANVSLVPGSGTGSWAALQSVPVLSRTYHVTSGDMDGDADLDLLITNDRGITQVLLNNARGQFAPATAILIGFEPFSMAAAADLNGDGALDIYTGNDVSNPSMPHGIDIFLNQAAVVTATTSGIKLVAIGAFPNPSHDQVTLLLPAGAEPVQVELHDALGRLLRTFPTQRPTATGELPISLVDLEAGIYLIELHTATYRSVRRITII